MSQYQRRSNKAARKLQKLEVKYADVWNKVNKQEVRIDTLIKEVRISGSEKIAVDTVLIDSLRSLIAKPGSDSIIYKQVVHYIKERISLDSIQADTLDIHLQIWYDNQKASIGWLVEKDSNRIVLKKQVAKVSPTRYVKVPITPIWNWLIIAILLILLFRKQLFRLIKLFV